MILSPPAVIHLVAGARPNFMKIAPLYKALSAEPEYFCPQIVHTGQHYDLNMSETFFREFQLPEPDLYLGVGSGSHAQQTAKVITAYEEICLRQPPQLTVVVGDVNSTMACAITAKKLNLPVAHLEAGLRSYDRTMPEEINRVITDTIADILWTPSPDADDNLKREGVSENRIRRVGNIMIDTLRMNETAIESRKKYLEFGVEPKRYGVMTLHRPSNVDRREPLESIVDAVRTCSERLPIVFLIHPRTKHRLEEFGLRRDLERGPNVYWAEPQGYVDFLSLVSNSAFVVTDSGGIQEETTVLNIPCLTLRENTERPITIQQGTNELIRPDTLADCLSRILDGKWKQGTVPDLWDGYTSGRIVRHLKEIIAGSVA